MNSPAQLSMDFDRPTLCGTNVAEPVNALPQPRSAPTGQTPRGADARSEAQRSIDALIDGALRYRSSAEYRRLLEFIRGFRDYAPFNGLLVDVQKPGSSYVAPADRWRRDYRRTLRAGAQPLAILQPFGPIMFVFDISDTEPLPDAPPLPREVSHPFDVAGTLGTDKLDRVIDLTVANAIRDGVRIHDLPFGAQLAGQITWSRRGGVQAFQVRRRPHPVVEDVPVRFDLEINAAQAGLTRYATLCHELAHLYCGHLGTPDEKWWPSRRYVDHRTAEFEAESVSAIAVWRLDPSADMPPYLDQHLRGSPDVPDELSLDRVMQVAGLITKMGQERLPLRKASPS